MQRNPSLYLYIHCRAINIFISHDLLPSELVAPSVEQSLCGPISICRSNAHMVYGLKHQHFTSHSITLLKLGLFKYWFFFPGNETYLLNSSQTDCTQDERELNSVSLRTVPLNRHLHHYFRPPSCFRGKSTQLGNQPNSFVTAASARQVMNSWNQSKWCKYISRFSLKFCFISAKKLERFVFPNCGIAEKTF